MGWWGAALVGAVGALVAGPLGALAGAALGHGLQHSLRRLGAEADLFAGSRVANRTQLKERFFEATFSVLGHLAKADGRVSPAEIAFAESVMDRMDLSPALRRAAILFFNQGKNPGFDLAGALGDLRRAGLGQGPLLQIFLEVQLGAAYVEGEPSAAKREILQRIRRTLQVPTATYRRLEQLILIQRQVLGGLGAGLGDRAWGPRRAPGSRRPAQDPLAGAYATLGVAPQASDAEVKRAYRRLMNRHHPDKLMSRGAPEEALKIASQKTQEILRAYETISRARA